jgi:hypothetical protein
MGLAISYSLNLNSASISQAREKVVELYEFASDLPFLEIGEIIELEGADCLIQQSDPHVALKVCTLTLEEIIQNLRNSTEETNCSYLIGFRVFPGNGCGQALFGLNTAMASGDNRDWNWKAFCKTQYANNPDYGGINNFLKCHLLVITMLEKASSLGIVDYVSDPSGYWENRDVEALVKTITEETVMMAQIMGSLKDIFGQEGYKAVAPIFDSPNFEYLEARPDES